MEPAISVSVACVTDVPAMAGLRGGGSALEETMARYLQGTYSPSFAMAERQAFVARVGGEFAGYVAGQRSARHGCDGELQWLNVTDSFRGRGVADALIREMLAWFRDHGMFKVCVNVDPANVIARRVYARHGATELDPHWLVWDDLRLAS